MARSDLEMDSNVETDFSISGREQSEISIADASTSTSLDKEEKMPRKASSSASAPNGSIAVQEEPTISGRDRSSPAHPCPKESHDKGRRSSAHLKYSAGKKKLKVDWTPELHKKFVQAVEKLGIDKAVPSRILELMGIGCLTRHNVASHLQKYRSHRKHMLSREAEALTWNQRRHMHCSAPNACTGKRDAHSSNVARTGFPQVTPPLHHHHRPPLHVWGHPSADQSLMYTWLNQPRDPTSWFWHQNVPAPGFPCAAPPYLPATKMPTPIVAGIPGTSMYRVDTCVGVPAVPSGQTLSRQPCDFYTSKERIDAILGDVLSKPWLPLPLGLKPPSIDSVIVELQRQGISKIPPTTFV